MKIFELQSQQDGFDSRMAEAELAATDQRSISEDKMARAELEASGMRTAYEQLKSDSVDQKLTSQQVGFSYLIGIESSCLII